jgi:hypothetical protein
LLRVSSIVVSGTIKSIVHSDNGGTTNIVNIVNKGCILHTGIVNDEPVVPIRIVLEQQIINKISLSVDRTISGNSGIPDFIEFLICLKLTEYEPNYMMYGFMNNVNVNQQIG